MRTVIARNEAISAYADQTPQSLLEAGGRSFIKALRLLTVRRRDCFVPRNDGRFLGFIVVLLCLFTSTAFAQSPYEDNVFNPAIKSVEFYNTAKQESFPAITLGTKDQALLAFDDLRGGNRTYNYTIEHCDENWNSSNLSTSDYLTGFTDDRILDYNYSSGTRQKYTHYQLKLPNENVAPKISGNYILKVYEDGDQSKLILTRRLYVVASKLSLVADIVPSNGSARQTNQKINVQVSYGNLPVQNPGSDIKVFIMQNARPETGVFTTQPTYIRGTQLVYDGLDINDFAAGNEFRHFDTRSLKLNSDRISHIYNDTAYTVMLLGDPIRNTPNYLQQYDNNGSFYILNSDGAGDPKKDADYTHVYFSLAANKTPQDGTAYIAGKFNNYKLDERSKLDYEPVKGRFMTDLYLKQGVYDYQYVWVDKKTGKPDDTLLEGSYFETENDYQVLVYYHPFTARWTELVGYRLLNNGKK